jgi:hypothetical protein
MVQCDQDLKGRHPQHATKHTANIIWSNATKISKEGTHNTYANIMDIKEPTGQICTDQTGRFSVQSSHGYKHIMILYDYDSNAILAEAMKSQSEHKIIQA